MVVEYQGDQVVTDGLFDGEGLDRWLPPSREGGSEPVDGITVRGDATVGGVHHHGDAGVVGQGPERVEQRVERAPSALGGGGGGRAHDHGARPVVESPGQLLGGPIRIGQGDVGRGTDTVSYTHLRAHETDSYLVCRLL